MFAPGLPVCEFLLKKKKKKKELRNWFVLSIIYAFLSGDFEFLLINRGLISNIYAFIDE